MDQFVTTYRKDYLWPYVKTFGLRPGPEQLKKQQYGDPNQLCECHCLQKPKPTADQVLGPLILKEESWSRQGPMGPLLDPKMYPAKVSDTPTSKTSNFNQPNVFLQKLQEKYPFIYECLRQAPPDDMISRINRDRLRSTYQVDYCKMMEYPSAPYDELLRAAHMVGSQPCSEPKILPGDSYRPSKKSLFSGSCQKKSGILDERMTICKPAYAVRTAGTSEYKDVISKLGTFIIRDKLHSLPRVPGRLKDAFMVNKNPIHKQKD